MDERETILPAGSRIRAGRGSYVLKAPAGAEAVEVEPANKGRTYLRKVACPECGYTIRVTGKWVARGLPDCPACSDKPSGYYVPLQLAD